MKIMLSKALVLAVIVLFIGAGIVPSISSDIEETKDRIVKKNIFGSPPIEQWNKTYGGTEEDRGYCVQQTIDGGYIISGGTNSFGTGGWLIKLNSNGEEEWNKTYGVVGDENSLKHVYQNIDGSYISLGIATSYGSGNPDVWLVKADVNGNEEWNNTYGGTNKDTGEYLNKTSDGGYIIGGITRSFGSGGNDFWLIKTDSNGIEQWNHTYGGINSDTCHSVRQITDGGYILTGTTWNYGNGAADVWLIKTDSNGNLEWDKTFGGGNEDHGSDVLQTEDGGYIITGLTASYGSGSYDVWLIKTDSDGNKEWDKTFGSSIYEDSNRIHQTLDGGYIIIGGENVYHYWVGNVLLIKTDSNGNEEWYHTIGGSSHDDGSSVKQTNDGGYIITGETASYGAGAADVWLIKIEGEDYPIADVYVDDDADPGWYDATHVRTIQEGIDNATAGDTVFVYNGTYYENVDITKNGINLIGEDKNTTVIDAKYGDGNGILIYNCDYVNVSGFSIRNAVSSSPGNGNGVWVYAYAYWEGDEHANNNTISNCTIYNNSHNGVDITATDVGLEISNNTISNCEIYENDYCGVHIGVDQDPWGWSHGRNNQILNSKIHDNGLDHSQPPTHTSGITISPEGEASHSLIVGCEVYSNYGYGLYIDERGGDANDNIIYHNHFYDNNWNVYDECIDTWYNATLQEGNYYDEYTGIDSDGDGIGDTPYDIPGGSNQDLYPLGYFTSTPDTVYIDDDYDSSTPGWQYDHFDSIQDGVDAVEGSTVYVYSGTYYENVVIDKSINLIGEDSDTTIIDGGESGDVVKVMSNFVNITNLSIKNSGHGVLDTGVLIENSDYCIIENCHFFDNYLGIYTRYCSNIQIKNCTCFNNVQTGMRIDHSSCYVTIENCTTAHNDNTGIVLLQGSHNNIIKNCVVNDNVIRGIYFAYGLDGPYPRENQIIDCEVFNNAHGIEIESSINNMVMNNYIHHNTIYGLECVIEWGGPADNNIIYRNNFIDNSQNAYDICTNFWYNATFQEGNYWSDYTGVDADGDGIGDTPYDIPGGSNQDLYPLGYFQNIPPVADFSYTPLNPTDLETIQFTDLSHDSDGTIVNWTWDFDDGNISYLQNPTHQYADDGTYLVNLTVMDNDYEYDSLNRLITVTNVPPVTDANGPYAGYVYQLIQFDGSGSYDLDGAIVSYDWNFGDGHTGTGVNPTHGYASDGIFIVTLTVEDDDGDTDTNYSATVIYTHQYPPVANSNGPYEGWVGEPIQFYGSATGGSKPYSWYWTFGDGQSSNLQNPTHTYDEIGVHTVVLKVTDNTGESDSDATTATIYPEGTLIADAGGPYSDYVNETIQLRGSASGGEQPYSWYWKFDDGNTSTLQNPTYKYSAIGEYTAILTVTDDFGQTDNDIAIITIKSHPPDKPAKPTGPISGKAGKEYTYSTSTTDPDGDQVYYKWYWNDKINETSDWIGPYDSGGTADASHIWNEKGDYIIRVKAKDVHGEESEWSDPLPITMPKTKTINPFILFLERLIERFPILEQILQPIYDKLTGF